MFNFFPDGPHLIMVAASSGFPDSYRIDRTLPIINSIAGITYRTMKNYISPNVNKDPNFNHDPTRYHKFLSLVCCPMVFEECLGVVCVDGKEENAFSDEHLEIIEAYTQIFTIARVQEYSLYYLEEEIRSGKEDAAVASEAENQ